MVVMVLAIQPAPTPPMQKLEMIPGAVEPRESNAIEAFLASIPAVAHRYLRNEPNLEAFLRDVREEMVLCAPLSMVVVRPSPPPPPKPQTSNDVSEP